MDKEKKKWIRVTMHLRQAYLLINIENSRQAPVDYDSKANSFRTTKQDQKEHGFGLKTVDNIVKRYNSKLAFEFTDDIFSVSTALKLPEKNI